MADDENTIAEAEDQEVEPASPTPAGEATEADQAANATAAEAEVAPGELSDEEKLMAKLQEAVVVEAHDIGPLRKKLDITVPRALIDDQMGEQFAELRREAAVPGFRRGRAPLRLVQKRFGHDVGDQVTTQLVSNGYLAAVKKLELNTLGEPQVWANMPEQVTDASGMNKMVVSEKLVPVEDALEQLRIPKEGDFSFSCEVELRPAFELPALDGIAIEKPTRSVTEADVTAEVQRLLSFRGRFAPIEGGPIQADDLVIGDLKVMVEGKSVLTEANALLAARDQRYAGLDLKGLGEALVGKQTGDEVRLEVTFPEDHDTAELRNQSGTFELTVRDLKRLVVPELTPELFSELGYVDEQAMRESVKGNLERRVHTDIKEALRAQVTKYLLEHTDFELPEGLSQRQADRIARRRMVEMYQAGVPEAEVAKRVDALRLRAAEEAKFDLKLFFLMDKIAEERKIEVTEDEMNGAIAAIATMQGKRFDRMRDELIKNEALSALYLRLRDGKILDGLLASAQVTET
ncbi:MAG: trigger factor [Planctomycetota bacterium]